MALTNTQFDALMRDYDLRRQEAAQDLEARTAEVREKIPAFASLEERISEAGIAAARRRVLAGSSGEDGTSALIERLAGQKAELLAAHGYPADYLEMRYRCPVCRDTGFTEDGKCACLRAAESALLTDRSALGGILEEENFSRFDLRWYPEDVKDARTGRTARELAETALEAARKTADGIGKDGTNLFLFGGCGVGKTFLSHCVAKDALDRGHAVLYYSAQDLVDLYGDAVMRGDPGAGAAADLSRTCDLLIIDDLGTELTNTFVNGQLFRCINDRILSRRTTVISTNLTLEGLRDTYSERIFSRIMSHYTIIKLIGNDIRLSRKLAGGSL